MAVLLWLGAPALAQFLPPPSMPNTGGISPRANQMKADARNVKNGSKKSGSSSSKSSGKTKSNSKSSGEATSTAVPTAPVHRAASEGNTDELKADLAAHPEDIKKKDGEGYMALHHAAMGNHLDSVQLLLDSGADINAQGLRGESALYLAAAQGNIEVVDALIKGGADPNLATTELRTPLQRAAMEGHLATVKALLKAGADPKAKDRQGRTALDLAERYRVGDDANQVISELIKAR